MQVFQYVPHIDFKRTNNDVFPVQTLKHAGNEIEILCTILQWCKKKKKKEGDRPRVCL